MVCHGGGGGCCLVTKRNQGNGMEGETEGTYSILTLMAAVQVNKQALFICTHAQIRCVSAPCSQSRSELAAPNPGESWDKTGKEEWSLK